MSAGQTSRTPPPPPGTHTSPPPSPHMRTSADPHTIRRNASNCGAPELSPSKPTPRPASPAPLPRARSGRYLGHGSQSRTVLLEPQYNTAPASSRTRALRPCLCQADIRAIAACPNTVCKISGIVARARPGWTPADLAPTVNHCLDAFGPDRVVFGGDWPVCLLGAPFGAWAAAVREIIAGRPEADQRKLLHDNAVALYGLG